MLKKTICGLVILGIISATLFVGGCETSAQSGTLIGAGGGALAGQAIGGDTKGTLIGAGIGAVGGYIVGNEMDKSKTQKQQPVAPAPSYSTPSYSTPSSESNTVTVWLNNSNGSQTPVKLMRNADGSYTGPRGERYQTMPTEDQLKKVYGM